MKFIVVYTLFFLLKAKRSMNYLEMIKNITTEDLLKNYLKGTEEGENCDFNVAISIKIDKSLANAPIKSDYIGICKVVGSFANTSGGILYLGVQEEKGVFTSISGIEIENWERLQKEINEKLRSVYDPVIENVFIKHLPLQSGKYVVIIGCPVSDDLHQLILEGQPVMFPKRVGPSVVGMTAGEVKVSCLKKDEVNQLINQRKERTKELLTSSSEFIVEKPSLILFAVPNQSDISLKTCEWEFEQRIRSVLNSFTCENVRGIISANKRLCAEGIRFFTDSKRHLLIKKNGSLELVCDIASNEKGIIHFGGWTKRSIALISHLLAKLTIETSCHSWRFAMTLVGVKEKKLRRGEDIFPYTSSYSLPKDKYELDFIKIETSSNPNQIILQLNDKYHPMLESVWHDVDVTLERPVVAI